MPRAASAIRSPYRVRRGVVELPGVAIPQPGQGVGTGNGNLPCSVAGTEEEGKMSNGHAGHATAKTGTLFQVGVIVGLGLAILGLVSGGWAGSVPSRLLLCSGLGIIFGAFGSTATIRYKGIVVAGVAAIAIVLLLLVDRMMREGFATIEIGGDVVGAVLTFDNERSYGMEDGRRRRQEFVFLGPEIKRQYVSLEVSLPVDAITGQESLLLFECINKAEIESHFGSGTVTQWRLNADSGRLTRDGKVIARNGEDCGDATAGRNVGLRAWLSLVQVAFAAQPPKSDSLFVGLESNSATIRRDARARLTALGPSGVPHLLGRLGATPLSYRTRLGIVVALTEILRKHKPQRKTIAAGVTVADLGRLAAAAADRDRTLRIYASEFLFDLGDTRVIEPAFVTMAKADDDGRYNLILVIGGARPALTPAQRAPVDRRLRALLGTAGPRTKALISAVVAGQPLPGQG